MGRMRIMGMVTGTQVRRIATRRNDKWQTIGQENSVHQIELADKIYKIKRFPMIPHKYQSIFMLLREEIQKPESVQWFEWKPMKEEVEKMLKQGLMQDLHTAMQEFYEGYLWKSMESYAAWSFIDFVAQRDDALGAWATGRIDLLALAERWIELGESKRFSALLTRLGETGYETDWEAMRTTLDEKLRRMEVEGTRNGMKETGYFFCLLHAFTMMMMSALPMAEKMALLKQFSDNWDFLRYMYSVMTRTIIGFGFANFAQLTNCLTNAKSLEPYYHLYHSPLKERFNELCDKGTKKEKLQKAFQKLEQHMEQVTPSDELNKLCEVLFPEDFREMLNRHRLKSYQELEGEIAHIKEEMNATVDALKGQAKELAERLRTAVEASVPVKEIENELLKFPSVGALQIFMQLNTLLVNNKAWMSQSGSIRDKILAKQQQEMLLNMNITAQSGANVNAFVQQQTNNSIDPTRQITS